MMVVIAYDICTTNEFGDYRLRRVNRICKNLGHQVQESVFECIITPSELVFFKKEIEELIDQNTDKVRIYILGDNWDNRIEELGASDGYDPKGVLIV